MNVKQLKAKLNEMPDNAIVVIGNAVHIEGLDEIGEDGVILADVALNCNGGVHSFQKGPHELFDNLFDSEKEVYEKVKAVLILSENRK